jgi:vancomycin resistance protein VanW
MRAEELTENIQKPQLRNVIRRRLGKEFYILRRKWSWLTANKNWVKHSVQKKMLIHINFSHSSVLLRQLKSVDMQLQYNKVRNLELAIEKINGVIINPGETFSFWKLVGRPTRSKGYLEGLVLENGKISKGIGGGICQLGNLLYWMLLHTSLEITERWRHSYDVFPDTDRKIPFGSGATLSYNYVDLQFTNITQKAFQLHVWLDDDFLNGEILSDSEEDFFYEVCESDHKFIQQWWGGYMRYNKLWKLKKNKITGYTEKILVTENHAIMMYNPLLESGEKK